MDMQESEAMLAYNQDKINIDKKPKRRLMGFEKTLEMLNREPFCPESHTRISTCSCGRRYMEDVEMLVEEDYPLG
jgi:hypothetical protein